MLKIIKYIYRLFRYKNQRIKFIREIKIRNEQNKLLPAFPPNKQFIIFIVDGASWFTGKDVISGGILSIASIYEETKNLLKDSNIIMTTSPEAHLLLKHTQFPNDINVFRFRQLFRLEFNENIIIHIPEYLFTIKLLNNIIKLSNRKKINKTNIQLNILNQRLDLMPDIEIINYAKQHNFIVTQTTAHSQYTNQEIRDKFEIPLHKLSVFSTPSRYNFVEYNNKENIILISPDNCPEKESILQKIREKLPYYELIIINNIPYLSYLSLIERAKYMITFGEGLDFYYIETVFSGGIAFAKYNNVFFTDRFRNLDSVYSDYKEMYNNICDDIIKYDKNIDSYKLVNSESFNECNLIYNDTDYKENIKKFYNKNYTFE